MIVKVRFFSYIPALTLILLLALYPGIPAISAPPTPPPETIGDPASGEGGSYYPDFTSCGGQFAPVVNAVFEQEVIVLVNSERFTRNLPPLKAVAGLTEAARYHAADLGQDDYFEHDTYDRQNGSLVYVCSTWTRIDSFYSGGRAENIAAGYTSPASVMAAWMNSAGHRNNILSTDNWEIGVSYYQGSGYYYRYWVQDFGKRSGVYPLIINNEAQRADDRNVSLYVYGTNWSEMRFRNNNEGWSNWQPFSNHAFWQLPDYSGEHTVYGELRYGSLVVSNSDSIYLELPEQPELGNLPSNVRFNYNLREQSFIPTRAILAPENVGDGQRLTWSVAQQGDWFEVYPTQGSTPDTFIVSPIISPQSDQQIYRGSVTVTVTSPEGVPGSPFVVDLELIVTNTELVKTFIPFSVVVRP